MSRCEDWGRGAGRPGAVNSVERVCPSVSLPAASCGDLERVEGDRDDL